MKSYVLIYFIFIMLAMSRSFLHRSMKGLRMYIPLSRLTTGPSETSKETFKKFDKELVKHFFKSTSSGNFDEAKKCFDEMIRINPSEAKRKFFLGALLNACQSPDQLSYGEQFTKGLMVKGTTLHESMVLPRVRIKCAEGKPHEALELVRNMPGQKMQPKLRDFIPVLESYCNSNTVDGVMTALDVVRSLRCYSIYPRPEQLMGLLTAARRLDIHRHPDFAAGFGDVLMQYRVHHYGVMHADAVKWVECFMNQSVSNVTSAGILATSTKHIEGKLVSGRDAPSSPGFVRISLDNPRHLVSHATPAVSVKDKNHSTPTEYPPFTPAVMTQPQLFSLRGEDGPPPCEIARLVHISAVEGSCPNCNMKLPTMSVDELDDGKDSLRDVIRDHFASMSPTKRELRHFEEYAMWLDNQKPYFDYVIDGANVAYYGQNVEGGGFRFNQIDTMYEAIKAKAGQTARILVILPMPYGRDMRPNSVSSNGDLTKTTASDKAVLAKLQRQNALYLARTKAGDDDLYAVYASLHQQEKRKTKTFVVTNDLLRNHKLLAFTKLRRFYRWRTLHQLQFTMIEKPRGGEDIKLYYPSPYVREIHYEKDRWHIPVVDSRSWLCLNIPSRELNAEDTSRPSSCRPSS